MSRFPTPPPLLTAVVWLQTSCDLARRRTAERLRDDRGQATTEYALVLLAAALVALLVVAWATAGGGRPAHRPTVQPSGRRRHRPGVIRRAPKRRDDGQAAVELALALPLVVVALLAVLQVGVLVRNEVALQHAAREGARAAAVSAAPASAANSAVRRALGLPVSVAVDTRGTNVTVTVTWIDPTDVAIVGAAIGPVRQVASATMAVEPP